MAKNITRRNFVGTMSCAAIGYSTLYNSLINLKAINALAASNSDLDPDYKALVCILKSGGNDSFNMLVPTTNNEYKEYQETRSTLALQKSELLALQTLNTPGREFGLHPALKGLQQLYNKGNVSFISNIGTLFEPVTKQKFIDQTAKLPLGLFSHSDQIQQWQTAIPARRNRRAPAPHRRTPRRPPARLPPPRATAPRPAVRAGGRGVVPRQLRARGEGPRRGRGEPPRPRGHAHGA